MAMKYWLQFVTVIAFLSPGFAFGQSTESENYRLQKAQEYHDCAMSEDAQKGLVCATMHAKTIEQSKLSYAEYYRVDRNQARTLARALIEQHLDRMYTRIAKKSASKLKECKEFGDKPTMEKLKGFEDCLIEAMRPQQRLYEITEKWLLPLRLYDKEDLAAYKPPEVLELQ
jgi:hypothetical protein